MPADFNFDELPDAPAGATVTPSLDLEALPDAPVPSPAEPPASSIDLAAWKSSRFKGNASRVLEAARGTGMAPDAAAEQLPAIDEQAKIDALKTATPGVQKYASQSGVHAAAVAPEAGALSWIERNVTGRWEDFDGESLDSMTGEVYRGGSRLAQPAEWMKELGQAFKEQDVVAIGLRELFRSDYGEMAPETKSRLDKLQEDAAEAQTARKGESWLKTAMMFPVRGVPYLGGLAASTIAGGPVGAFLFNTAQNAGPLYLQLRDLKDEDGINLLQDDHARFYSLIGAEAAGILMEAPGLVLASRLPGGKQAVGKVATDAVAEMFSDRPFVKALVQYGTNVGSGALLMGAQAGTNAATVELSKGSVGAPSDLSNAGRAFLDAAKDGALGMLALGAVHPVLERVGQGAQARRDAARLGASIEAAKATKMAPQDFAQAVEHMADVPGAADTVHIDTEAWNKRFGDQAAQIHAETAGDGGKGYAEAQATGAPLEVPIADHLAKLSKDGHAEALLQDSKLTADGLTPREARERPMRISKNVEDWRAHESEDPLAQTVESDPVAAQIAEQAAPREPRALAAPVMPESIKTAFETELKRDDYRDAARQFLFDKPLKQIQPGRYEQAAAKAIERAISFAGEHDKLNDKIVAEYAKALDITDEAARAALVAQRSAQMGAGLERGSGGDLGATTLKGAGKQAAIAERQLGKADAVGERISALEGRHAAAETERAQKLAELRSQQVLSQEMAKEAARIQDKMQTALGKLVKGADAPRGKIGLAGREYLGVYDSLLGAVGAADMPTEAGDSTAMVARLRADGHVPVFDQGAVADLLASPRPWSSLTVREAQNVLDAVKQIRHIANTAGEVALGERRASVQQLVGEVQAHADENHYPTAEPPAPSRAGGPEPVGKIEKLHVEGLQPETILERLGPAGRQVYDAFVKSRNAKEALSRDVGGAIAKAVDGIPKELRARRFDSVEGPGSPVFADNKWTRQDLWTLALWMGSESGAERAVRGLKVDEQAVYRALAQLTPDEVGFINSIHKLNDSQLWPLVRDHMERTTGVAPPKVEARPFTLLSKDGETLDFTGGYHPAKYRKTQSATPVPEDISSQWGSLGNVLPDAVSKGFTNARAAHFADVPDLNWGVYPAHVNSVLHLLAYDDFVRGAGRLFRDQGFRDVVQGRVGPQEMAELDKFLTTAARGRVEAATDGANNWNQVLGGAFRSRVAAAAFQLNVPIVIGQLSHLPAAAAGLRIGPLDMGVGLAKAFTPGAWRESHAESQQLPYRWDGYGSHLREMLSGIGPEEAPAGRRWIDAAGWSMYHAMDGFLSQVIYQAAKRKFGGDVAAADHAVSVMMPKLNIAEQSSVARDRGMLGSLMLVRNFPNTLYNVGAMNAWQARTGVWAADPGLAKVGAALGGGGAAALSYLGMVWSAHIVGRFLMGHGPDQDETGGEWLAHEALTAPFYPIPLGSDVVGPLAMAATTDKTLKQSLMHGGDIRAAPALAMVQGALKDVATATDEGAEMPDRVQSASRMMATALRLPTWPLKPIRYGYDLSTGAQSPRGPLDVAGGFLYGQRDKQAANPGTWLQDKLSGQ